jgi:ubiquinone biosynthesis protein UbiJ
MATQSPFSLLGSVFERMAAGPQPPQWLVHEVQHRVVLLLNHVLDAGKPAATQRLVPSRGRVVRMQWRHFFMALKVTPAGLFDLALPSRPRPICAWR